MKILKKRILLPNFRKLIREKIDTELIRIATLEQGKIVMPFHNVFTFL